MTAERLLEGLSALTEHAFACESIEREGEAITLTWSSEASLMPGVDAPMEVESPQLTFYDFDSTLQFMLDSAYHTLVNNLGVQKVFSTPSKARGCTF